MKVLITGGNGGIAQALKGLLLAEGYEVWAATRTELDVTDWHSIDTAMRKFTPDILVNNAGYVVPKSVKEMDLENTKRHFDPQRLPAPTDSPGIQLQSLKECLRYRQIHRHD